MFAAIHKPEEQPDKLFRSLGFEQTRKEWSDSQKAEDRQEKLCNRHNLTAPADEPVRTTMNMKNAAGHTDRHHRHHRWQVPPPAGRGRCRSWQQSRPGAGAHSQPHGHSGRMTSPLPCSPACPASRTSASLFRSSPARQTPPRHGNRVCDAVVDRVNEHLPGNIDPGKTITSEQEHHERSTTHLPCLTGSG